MNYKPLGVQFTCLTKLQFQWEQKKSFSSRVSLGNKQALFSRSYKAKCLELESVKNSLGRLCFPSQLTYIKSHERQDKFLQSCS